MNVLCYMQPHRGGGVARHAMEMVSGLLSTPGISGELIAGQPDANRHPAFRAAFGHLPINTLPLSNRIYERAWKLFGYPPLTRRCRGFDVLYAPAEVRFPACGIPTVVTIHDVQALETSLPWSSTKHHLAFRAKWQRWLPKVIHEAAQIVTVSEFSRQRMCALLGASQERIAVIGNGVSPIFFHPAAGSRRHEAVVAVVGGLRTKKGADHTLRVAECLRRRRSALVIEVIGEHEPAWASEAAAHHSNVRLRAGVDDAALAARLQSASALLFLSPYEGFGIPAVEAMASGAPVVVANAAALPEVVGAAGIIVDADDTESIADALERLHEDEHFRGQYVAAGFERVKHHAWPRCVERLTAVLRDVTSPSRIDATHHKRKTGPSPP